MNVVNRIGSFKTRGSLLTARRTYDGLNRLQSVTNYDGSGVALVAHAYEYNAANQRTAVTNADGARWTWQYDKLGQVGSATNIAAVTVNLKPTQRHDDYFRAELNSDNSVNPVHLSVTNVAVKGSRRIVYLPVTCLRGCGVCASLND